MAKLLLHTNAATKKNFIVSVRQFHEADRSSFAILKEDLATTL